MKNNKGFSLIEMVVSLAIMAIVASIGMVSFSMATHRTPYKVQSNLESCAKYAKNLVMSEDEDYCMLLFKTSGLNGNYYAVYGTATGDSQTDLKNSFRSQKIIKDSHGNLVNDRSNGHSIAEIIANPNIAENRQQIGNFVTIGYNSASSGILNPIGDNQGSCLIIKFRKFDGSVIAGDGQYAVTSYRSTDLTNPKLKMKLVQLTGVFSKN